MGNTKNIYLELHNKNNGRTKDQNKKTEITGW